MRYARVVIIALLMVPGVFQSAAVAQVDQTCYAATRHCLGGQIRFYWGRNGGLPVFGFPITADQYQSSEGGGPYITQWMQRNRIELHPENQAPYDVQLGRLGESRLLQLGRHWREFPTASPSSSHYFAATGHAIAHEPFWNYWRAHGVEFGDSGVSERESLALFGYPLSEPMMETNVAGDTVLTQWFERARFEWHPTNPEPFQVLLGLLGNEVLNSDAAVQSSGRIAFMRNADLYVVNPDGSGTRRLTDGTSKVHGNFAWSPDGQTIAFFQEGYLSLVDATGGNARRLVNRAGRPDSRPPAWAPDGERIAFALDYDLYVASANDGTFVRIAASPAADDVAPTWSGDGQRIVFMSNRMGRYDLYAVNPDGNAQVNLTNTPLDDELYPAWSPDGQRIAFMVSYSSGSDVFVINADGSERRKIRRNIGEAAVPVWSPDARRMAFTDRVERLQRVRVVDVDAPSLGFFTNYPANSRNPSWSPDGAYLSFYGDGPAGRGIYTMRDDSSRQRLLVADGDVPFWSPR